jgi:hypothetical protein
MWQGIAIKAGRAALAAALSASAAMASAPPPRALDDPPREVVMRSFDLGPIASRDLTVAAERRFRAAGPFVESQTHPDGHRFTALRPLFSQADNAAEDRRIREVLWPLGSFRTWKGQSSWRLATAYGQDFDLAREDSRYRFVIFPFWFQGRDAAGASYAALFPLGGTIHEYLGQDELRFALWPLYGSTRINDVRSHAVLWPFVAWSEGPRSRSVRVFPFYGKSERDDRSTRRFVLWPLWTSVDYMYPDAPGGGFVLFPLFGHAETPETESWMFLPPFFRFSRGVDYHEVFAPWPFVQYLNSLERDRFYLWPLWGRKTTPREDTTFCLWPLLWSHRIEGRDETTRRKRFVPLFDYEVRHASAPDADPSQPPTAETPVLGRYWKLWPLMSYKRDGDAARFRALDIWPTRSPAPFDRNLAPFFTLYSHTTAGRDLDEEFLWGLVRRRRTGASGSLSVFPLFSRGSGPDATEWSVLGGLLGRRQEGWQTTWKALYFLRFGTGSAGTPGAVPSEMDKP